MEKILVDVNELSNVLLNFIGSDEFDKLINNCEHGNSDFKHGAVWGMAMASIKASTKCTQYVLNVKGD